MTRSEPSKPSGAAAAWWPVLAVAALALVTRDRPLPASATEPQSSGRHAGPAAAEQPGRGREAEGPTQIPARGWKDIAFRLYEDLSSHRILSVAAGVTFYALLAVFPAVAALVSLYGLFADPASIAKQMDTLSGLLPGGAVDIIGEQVKRISANPRASLSFALAFSLGISLWSANAGMKAVFDALNVVYDETEKRSFVVLNLVSLAFTLGALTFMILALVAVVALPIALNFIGLGTVADLAMRLGRWPLLLVAVALVFALVYRFGPSRKKAQWRWVWAGSAFAAVAWLGGSALFSWYVSSFGNYNATYGSLGAAIGFMTWLWISSIIVLMGGELNAEMEHQTARDTTTSGGKPMGQRGATMADQVGKASGA